MRGWAVILLCVSAAACKPRQLNDVKQIFTDEQRKTARGDDFPFILSLDSGCTAFIVDAKKNLAITAKHCATVVGARLCVAPDSSKWTSGEACPHLGKVTAILVESQAKDRDFALFQFAVDDGYAPVGAVRLNVDPNLVDELAQKGTAIRLVGYPTDPGQNGKLTVSDCVVRSRVIVEGNEPAIGRIAKQMAESKKLWEIAQGFCGSCLAFEPTVERFYTDCSVYGGNSGGPILINDTVIGLPVTYYPNPEKAATWSEKYNTSQRLCRETVAKALPEEASTINKLCPSDANPQMFANWNKLDRSNSSLRDFPKAVAAHTFDLSKFLTPTSQQKKDPPQPERSGNSATKPVVIEDECYGSFRITFDVRDASVYCIRWTDEKSNLAKTEDGGPLKPEPYRRSVSYFQIRKDTETFQKTGFGVLFGSFVGGCNFAFSGWSEILDPKGEDIIKGMVQKQGDPTALGAFAPAQIAELINLTFKPVEPLAPGKQIATDCVVLPPKSER